LVHLARSQTPDTESSSEVPGRQSDFLESFGRASAAEIKQSNAGYYKVRKLLKPRRVACRRRPSLVKRRSEHECGSVAVTTRQQKIPVKSPRQEVMHGAVRELRRYVTSVVDSSGVHLTRLSS